MGLHMDDLDAIARQVNPQGEQGIAATRAWATQLATFYRGLREQGVGVESATYLARDYQQLVFAQARWQGQGGL